MVAAVAADGERDRAGRAGPAAVRRHRSAGDSRRPRRRRARLAALPPVRRRPRRAGGPRRTARRRADAGDAAAHRAAAAIDSPVSEASASPFAAEIDFRAALATLRAGLPGHHPLSLPDSRAAARRSEAKSPAAAPDAPAADLPVAATPAAPTALAPAPQAIAPKLADAGAGPRVFDAASIRSDFPILQEKVHGSRLIWLDNAATTQKPQAVIDRLAYFYEHENSNIHRAAHALAARATDAYEAARDKVRRFLNASSTKEIVFVRGATEGINLVAQSWGRRNVGEGDEIVVTWLEHHANIVPWQKLCAATGREAAGGAGRRPRPGHARRVREAARPAHPHRRADPGLQRARHGDAGARR